jgi:chemotaxis protein histidine kinase CheA
MESLPTRTCAVAVRERIESIAKSVVRTDAGDLPGLVSLQEQFQAIAGEIDEQNLNPLIDLANRTADLIGEIVLREVEDVDAAFATLCACVDYAQEFLDAVEQGAESNALPHCPLDPEPEAQAPAADIDEELLSAWINGCEDALNELENIVIQIEQEGGDGGVEAQGEARRIIHTLKGEAGVLSLHEAQSLCHDAESLIDERIDAGKPFPTDEVLALRDWMRDYVFQLGDDPTTPAPEHAALSEALKGEGGGAAKAEGTPDEPPAGAEEAEADSKNEEESSPEATAEPDAPVEPAAETAEVGSDEPIVFPPELLEDENLNDFLCEAREHIENSEAALLELEHEPEDVELINTVFRAFHTVKGVAGFMNLTPIVTLAHTAETLLDKARNGELTLDSAYMDLILQACDMLSRLAGALEGDTAPSQGEHASIVARLKQAIEGKITASAAPSPECAPDDSFHPLGEILVGLGIVSKTQITEALAKQRDRSTELQRILIDAGLKEVGPVEEALIAGSDAGRLIQERLVTLGFIDAEHLANAIEARRGGDQRLGDLLGLSARELAKGLHEQRSARRKDMKNPDAGAPAEASAPAAKATKVEHKAASAPEPKTADAARPAAQAKRRIEQTVKVSTTRMDNLLEMVGELVIAHQMVAQDPTLQTSTASGCKGT